MQMSNTKIACDQNGFSLVELLIAMAILAFGMLAAASMQYSSIRNNTKGNVYTQANMLAKAQLEALKSRDVDDLVPGNYSDAEPLDENGEPGGIYNRTWNIANFGGQSRRLTVTVQWVKRGVSESVEISSNTRGNGV
jgi:type IV pilus assembly protein PilV